MTGTPRCDYIPMWSSSDHRCAKPALVRVLWSHGAGINPVYKDRCLAHASGEFGPHIAAYWDTESGEWKPAGRRRLGD